jgi:hypothetical protein
MDSLKTDIICCLSYPYPAVQASRKTNQSQPANAEFPANFP